MIALCVDITKFWLNIFDWLSTKARSKLTERWNTMSANIFHSEAMLWWKAQLWNSRRWTVGRLSAPKLASALSGKMWFTHGIKDRRARSHSSDNWSQWRPMPAYRFLTWTRAWPIRINSPNPSSFRRCWLENVDQRLHLHLWSLSYGDWILRPIAIRKSLFFCPFHHLMNMYRDKDCLLCLLWKPSKGISTLF